VISNKRVERDFFLLMQSRRPRRLSRPIDTRGLDRFLCRVLWDEVHFGPSPPVSAFARAPRAARSQFTDENHLAILRATVALFDTVNEANLVLQSYVRDIRHVMVSRVANDVAVGKLREISLAIFDELPAVCSFLAFTISSNNEVI